MLVLEDLISKMKVHFPRWMDIRRKVTSSNGGIYLSSIAGEIADIQECINEYKKDFFLDKYIGNEDEVLTYLYKYHVGILEDESSLEVVNPEYVITKDQNKFYNDNTLAYYEDGFIYIKENIGSLTYSIDGYNSMAEAEKIHVWNIFDEFAIFIGLKRYQWESNSQLLNRTLAFANNKVNSTEDGLKNAIINNLINIDNSITKEDIIIERPTASNLIKYYDEAETILDHLANINRDVYRTKRWDLDTWNFAIKSIDYIPHAWDIALSTYANGVGFDDDLKVEIVDAESKTDAKIYFYKKTLEYINSYIKNNSISENIKLDLKKHSDSLVPTNVKYRITGTELQPLDVDNINIQSYDYKIGDIEIPAEELFDEEVDEFYNIEIKDDSILDPALTYKLRFKSLEELKEMSIDKLYIHNTKTNQIKPILVNMPGFEKTTEYGMRSTLTKKYISEKYDFISTENAVKEVNGFTIADVEKPTLLTAEINNCQNEDIYYDFQYEELPVLFSNIERVNCYLKDNTILSDTVTGEKYIALKIKANTFSCKINGPHKVVYSINKEVPKIKEHTMDRDYEFKIDGYNSPQDFDIKIYLNAENNKQCSITDIMYSKFEFKIYTDYGDLVEIGDKKRLPNVIDNKLYVEMKTYTGFSPVLKYIYIGTKVQNIVYGDLDITPEDGDKLIMEKSNCIAELEAYSAPDTLDHFDYNYVAAKTFIGLSDDSYITLNLNNFKKFDNITANGCQYDYLTYGSNIQHIIKIPSGEYLKTINVTGSYEKKIFEESLHNILKRKGYSTNNYSFYAVKTNNNIVVQNNDTGALSFVKIKRTDLLSYIISKVKIDFKDKNIQAMFIEDGENKVSTITNIYEGSYDFISFYPVSTKIYKAINEYNIISPTTIVPNIINTFDNGYGTSNEYSFFYTIETLNEDFDVKFINEEKVTDYSFDFSKIQINIKDTNNLNFDYEEMSVSYDSIIGNTIAIPESFISNKEKIEIARYCIENEDLNIDYLTKYKDPLHANDYIVTEILTVENLLCNKLRYCNINEIESLSCENDDIHLAEGTDYVLYKKEGIIWWNSSDEIESGTKITVKYNYKKPANIIISTDELYEKVNFTTNAYELLSVVDIYNVNNEETYNISLYDHYKDSDLVSIKCSNIGFEAEANGSIITFNKKLKNNTVAVKAGYYYLDGDEYYLFADENSNDIEQFDNVYFFNVLKENKKLYLYQTTTNKVTNSSLTSNSNGEIFRLNCNDKNIKGISKINSITTCDNYNYWNSIGMDISIVKGLNGPGIKFAPTNYIDGYAFLDITKHLPKDGKEYIISFYKNGGRAYLGQEKLIYSATNEFNKRSVIEPAIEALESAIEDDIFEVTFKNDGSKKYYLIVKGNCLIDDIIVQETEYYNIDDHIKNIDSLNLNIVENIYANYQTRLYLDDTEGAVFKGTEHKDEMIVNSSYIDWGFTKVKDLSNYDEFKSCTLNNVDIIKHNNNCYIKTTSEAGTLTTSPIYLGNVKTINNLIFKINDVMFENMKGFKIKVLTSSNEYTGFKEVSMHLDNIGSISGDNLSSYIKLIVEMPSNKVINNIELFIEYLSDDLYNPPEVPVINGEYISKVLDAQYNERFLIKDFKFSNEDTKIHNLSFFVRASKENTDDTVWTEWKEILLTSDNKISSRIVFDGYRYFQFRTILKGENSSVRIKHLDLEVI